MGPAIRTSNLSKRYRIGTRPKAHYRTLRESIADSAAALWRRTRRTASARASKPTGDVEIGNLPRRQPADSIMALDDVSFEVQPGEVVGIIGRNGAGKSTLLKILSRITEPSSGRAELRGRIGSLLEVGTGFHPELTGRDNILLSGAILGMTRREILGKFDQIVAFADVEQFLDTPVKRYSSGMHMRLAFSVAAHLETEILVVDEVLAVGDAEFQRKSLGKMQDAGREGKTVLFVSHNMAALQALCRRGLILERGRLLQDATIGEAVASYLGRLGAAAAVDLSRRTDRRGAGRVRLMGVRISSDGPSESGEALMGRPALFSFYLSGWLKGVTCIFSIVDAHGCQLVRFNSGLGSLHDDCHLSHERVITCTVDEMLLAPGRYRLDVALWANGELQDGVQPAAHFEVVRGPVRGREPPRDAEGWLFYMPHRWRVPG